MFLLTVILIKSADGIVLVGVSLIILYGSSSVTIQILEDSLLVMYFITNSVLYLD